jgi:hypothetical protein
MTTSDRLFGRHIYLLGRKNIRQVYTLDRRFYGLAPVAAIITSGFRAFASSGVTSVLSLRSMAAFPIRAACWFR